MNALRQRIGGVISMPTQSRITGAVYNQNQSNMSRLNSFASRLGGQQMQPRQQINAAQLRQIIAQRGQASPMASRFSGGMAAPSSSNAIRMFRGMGSNQPISTAFNRGIAGGLQPAQRVNMQNFQTPASAKYLGV